MQNKITIGVTDLSFHRVTASLVANVLVDMGFEVERIYSPHQENFAKLKSGEVDMLSSAWLPSSHGIYKSDVEEVEPLLELGLHYKPYALWGVPDYIPEEAVAEVDDLLKPEVLSRMKKDIQGINPGAGITRFSIQMMDEYNLNDVGYKFYTGTEEDCFNAFEQAVANKEWVVVPLWKPQFLHHKYTIREIAEPKGLLGIVDRAVLLLRQDRSSYFSQDQINKLDSLRFSNEIIAALDYQVSREGKSLDDVTKAWLTEQK
ncbi:glycine betaine ABC transporter substrate-binding protein [Moritella viscosa]|uniref:ABC-type glycine betaine transport system,substrate binding domain n=1 Tax=Moritella viscosa TaxID=80854 RepID=A0A090IM84_9GAMM|nr:glycine betaine ABC transporter substrate-binding protein [Moritella viscosa]CED61524.1 ABC-type glycine betaine transport system,substrate binding domain [Moritella viscosa]SGY89391.1 ABC-type glycine betaine transport system,substrate binding domain [Moritella viscosa]SGY93193.1 ABC-type glycine betaine transport system,substrate binding domain [Moritella viscosa]SGY93483.1 ABC-type glycine betaine transport system,substrate binding domain [Moritella viscosa]SGY97397.1 ABC-type glycine be